MTDRTLLDQFVRTRSHEAFATLVQRHIGIVYNAARRQVRDPALADDVCQAVFIVLARRAASLSPEVILPGWLIRTTHLTARDALKVESRRRAHEQRYAAMSPTQTTAAESTDVFAHELSPQIDRALSQLNDADRAAIVLRYLEGQSLPEVAAAFNVSIETTTKRLHRAMVRLREHFSRHPITPSVAAISAAMQHLPQASPPVALAHAATASALAPAASATSSLIANGALKMIFWAKAKIAVAMLTLALLGTATVGAISIVRAQTDAAPTSTPSAPPVAPNSPTTAPVADPQSLIGHLADGVSIEIVGISENPSTGKPWWRADGSPLPAPPPAANVRSVFNFSGPTEQREIIVRINDRLAGSAVPATVSWSLADGGPGFRFPGRNVRGLESRVLPVSNLDPVTLRANVASGAWQTLFHSGPAGDTKKVGDDTYTCDAATEVGGRTHFSFTQPRNIELATQVIAIDTAGKPHNLNSQRMDEDGRVQTNQFVVAIPLRMLKEIQFQTRPYDQWIEIRNVCLEPAHPTEVKVATSDEPPQGL